jgi:HEAT repeat protein
MLLILAAAVRPSPRPARKATAARAAPAVPPTAVPDPNAVVHDASSVEARRAAVKACSTRNTGETRRELIRAAEFDSATEVRFAATQALARARLLTHPADPGFAEACGSLRRVSEADPDPAVRAAAGAALSEQPSLPTPRRRGLGR